MNPQQETYGQWDRLKHEELVREHLPMVYRTANRVASATAHGTLETGDLVSAGVIGLYKAISNYDPSKGVPFAAFAMRHVRGHMLDEVSHHRQIPRGLRDKQRLLHQAHADLAQRLMREPEDAELAVELAISLDELHKWWVDLNWTAAFSLDELESGDGSPEALIELREDANPADVLDAGEARQLLQRALRRLTQREQQVLYAYYEEELTLKEIAEVLDLSESQISRIRSKAVLRLRGMLAKQTDAAR